MNCTFLKQKLAKMKVLELKMAMIENHNTLISWQDHQLKLSGNDQPSLRSSRSSCHHLKLSNTAINIDMACAKNFTRTVSYLPFLSIIEVYS